MSFVTEASIDLAEDPEMMQLMLDANIDTVFVGIESPNEESLRETKKIQNLTDRSGTALEKIHRIQNAGLLVSGGMIVGFDNDDASVFDLQRRFVEESRVAQIAVGMLFAIPQTPLYKRLENEGRLCELFPMSNWGSAAATNVVPLRMTIDELRDGYFKLLDDLYHPDAFFARMDAMCFETGWLPAPGRTRYLRRHPLRRLRLRTRAGIEALYIFVQLMLRVSDPSLRRRYRQQLLKVLLRRPNPRLVRIYAMFCALHFHYDKLIAQVKATPPAISKEGNGLGQVAAENPPAQSIGGARGRGLIGSIKRPPLAIAQPQRACRKLLMLTAGRAWRSTFLSVVGGRPMILSAIAEKLKRRSKDDFKGRHFEAPLIVQAVSWYLRYSPSLGQLSSIRSCIGMR